MANNRAAPLTEMETAIMGAIKDEGRTARDLEKAGLGTANELASACIALIKRGLVTTLEPRDSETVYTAVDGAAAEHARVEYEVPAGAEERKRTVLRRAKILSLLDGAGLTPTAAEVICADILIAQIGGLTTVDQSDVDADLVGLRDAKLIEFRSREATGGDEGWILTLAGTKAVEGKAWSAVAEESVRAEEREDGDEGQEPSGAPAANGAATWAAAAAASAEARADEQPVAKPARRRALEFPRSETRTVSVPLSEERREKIRARHLEVLDEIDKIEAERKAENERLNAARKQLEAEEAELRPKARAGSSEDADVDCTLRLDGSTVRVIRSDNGEVIEERAATREELEAARQLPLPLDAAPPSREPKPPTDPEQAVRTVFNGVAISKTDALKLVRGIDPKAAAKAFEELKDAGELVPEGKGRATKYRLASNTTSTS